MKTKFNHTGHKSLWSWLADHPGKSKSNYFKDRGIERNKIPYLYCYACDYDYDVTHDPMSCGCCPLCAREDCQRCLNGLYEAWDRATARALHKECSQLARRIAELPVKPGVECI